MDPRHPPLKQKLLSYHQSLAILGEFTSRLCHDSWLKFEWEEGKNKYGAEM